MTKVPRHCTLALALCLTIQASPQSSLENVVRKLGKLIDTMAVRGVDRRYIDAPQKPWQLILRGNVNQSSLKMQTKGDIGGLHFTAEPYLKTEPTKYVGLWAGYRGYGLGYTVNVAGDKGAYLTLGATGGTYGVNLRIHSFQNDHPQFGLYTDIASPDEQDQSDPIDLADPIKVRSLFADAYYLFNGKRFSYAAAYDQSVLQLRSAGSFVAGAMYYYGHVNYATHHNADLIYLMHGLGRVKLWQGSVGAGYAYNWVPVPGLLVSAMAMPMLTLLNKIKVFGYTTNVSELLQDPMMLDADIAIPQWEQWYYSHLHVTPASQKTYNSGLTVNFDARLSVTYNIGRYFLNACGQFSNNRYSHDNTHGHMNDWYVNTSIGLRL